MAGQARGRSGQWRTRGHRQHASSEMPVRCGARPLALLLLLLVVHALATARTAAQQHHVNHRQEEQQHYSASLQLSSATTTSAWASRSGGPWPLVEDAPAGGATGEAQARELLVGTDSCLALQATTVRELVSRFTTCGQSGADLDYNTAASIVGGVVERCLGASAPIIRPLPLLTFNETLVVLTTIQSTFTQLTNYTVSYTVKPWNAGPNDELTNEALFALGSNFNPYFGYVWDTLHTVDMWQAGAFADLRPFIATDTTDFEWDDMFPYLRNSVVSYGDEVLGLPVINAVQFMFYRRDIFAARNLTVPNTWDELAEVVARLNGTDTNGDRRPDFALCADTIGFFNFILLTQIMASVTQTKGPSQGVYFEPLTLQPLTDTPALTYALAMHRNLTQYAVGVTNGIFNSPFEQGRCAVGLSHAVAFKQSLLSPRVKGKVGVAPVPGSKVILNRPLWPPTPSSAAAAAPSSPPPPSASPAPAGSNGYGLQQCTKATCGESAALPNGTTYYFNRVFCAGCIMFAGGIAPLSQPSYMRAMYQFWSMAAGPNISTQFIAINPVSPMGPMRLSQLDPAKWTAVGYDARDVDDWIAVHRYYLDSLAPRNLGFDLRVPHAGRFREVLSDAARLAAWNVSVPIATIAETTHQRMLSTLSEAIAAVGGRAKFQSLYWRGIKLTAAAPAPRPPEPGAPPPTPQPSPGAVASSTGSSSSVDLWVIVVVVAGLVVLLLGGLAVWRVVARRGAKGQLNAPLVAPPAGALTSLVVTDVEGATPLMEAWPEVMDAALLLHNEVLLVCAREANGYVSATEGDSMIIAFHNPTDAVLFCATAQASLLSADWGDIAACAERCRPVWVTPPPLDFLSPQASAGLLQPTYTAHNSAPNAMLLMSRASMVHGHPILGAATPLQLQPPLPAAASRHRRHLSSAGLAVLQQVRTSLFSSRQREPVSGPLFSPSAALNRSGRAASLGGLSLMGGPSSAGHFAPAAAPGSGSALLGWGGPGSAGAFTLVGGPSTTSHYGAAPYLALSAAARDSDPGWRAGASATSKAMAANPAWAIANRITPAGAGGGSGGGGGVPEPAALLADDGIFATDGSAGLGWSPHATSTTFSGSVLKRASAAAAQAAAGAPPHADLTGTHSTHSAAPSARLPALGQGGAPVIGGLLTLGRGTAEEVEEDEGLGPLAPRAAAQQLNPSAFLAATFTHDDPGSQGAALGARGASARGRGSRPSTGGVGDSAAVAMQPSLAHLLGPPRTVSSSSPHARALQPGLQQASGGGLDDGGAGRNEARREMAAAGAAAAAAAEHAEEAVVDPEELSVGWLDTLDVGPRQATPRGGSPHAPSPAATPRANGGPSPLATASHLPAAPSTAAQAQAPFALYMAPSASPSGASLSRSQSNSSAGGPALSASLPKRSQGHMAPRRVPSLHAPSSPATGRGGPSPPHSQALPRPLAATRAHHATPRRAMSSRDFLTRPLGTPPPAPGQQQQQQQQQAAGGVGGAGGLYRTRSGTNAAVDTAPGLLHSSRFRPGLGQPPGPESPPLHPGPHAAKPSHSGGAGLRTAVLRQTSFRRAAPAAPGEAQDPMVASGSSAWPPVPQGGQPLASPTGAPHPIASQPSAGGAQPGTPHALLGFVTMRGPSAHGGAAALDQHAHVSSAAAHMLTTITAAPVLGSHGGTPTASTSGMGLGLGSSGMGSMGRVRRPLSKSKSTVSVATSGHGDACDEEGPSNGNGQGGWGAAVMRGLSSGFGSPGVKVAPSAAVAGGGAAALSRGVTPVGGPGLSEAAGLDGGGSGGGAWSVLQVLQAQVQEVEGPELGGVLVFCGLSVRMGVHCGVRAEDAVFNKAVGRMQYGGASLAAAKAVCDAAVGGMVLLSQSAFMHLSLDRLTTEQILVGHGGEFVLKTQAPAVEASPRHAHDMLTVDQQGTQRDEDDAAGGQDGDEDDGAADDDGDSPPRPSRPGAAPPAALRLQSDTFAGGSAPSAAVFEGRMLKSAATLLSAVLRQGSSFVSGKGLAALASLRSSASVAAGAAATEATDAEAPGARVVSFARITRPSRQGAPDAATRGSVSRAITRGQPNALLDTGERVGAGGGKAARRRRSVASTDRQSTGVAADQALGLDDGEGTPLYMAVSRPLIARLALFRPIRAVEQLGLGFLQAPCSGAACITYIRPVGVGSLMAWNAEVTQASLGVFRDQCRRLLFEHSGVVCDVSDELGVLAAFPRPGLAARCALQVIRCCLEADWDPRLLDHPLGEEVASAAHLGPLLNSGNSFPETPTGNARATPRATLPLQHPASSPPAPSRSSTTHLTRSVSKPRQALLIDAQGVVPVDPATPGSGPLTTTFTTSIAPSAPPSWADAGPAGGSPHAASKATAVKHSSERPTLQPERQPSGLGGDVSPATWAAADANADRASSRGAEAGAPQAAQRQRNRRVQPLPQSPDPQSQHAAAAAAATDRPSQQQLGPSRPSFYKSCAERLEEPPSTGMVLVLAGPGGGQAARSSRAQAGADASPRPEAGRAAAGSRGPHGAGPDEGGDASSFLCTGSRLPSAATLDRPSAAGQGVRRANPSASPDGAMRAAVHGGASAGGSADGQGSLGGGRGPGTGGANWGLTSLEELEEAPPADLVVSSRAATFKVHRKLLMRGLRIKAAVDWGDVRASLHPITSRVQYLGKPLNRAARVLAAACTGQVWMTQGAWDACDVEDLEGGPSPSLSPHAGPSVAPTAMSLLAEEEHEHEDQAASAALNDALRDDEDAWSGDAGEAAGGELPAPHDGPAQRTQARVASRDLSAKAVGARMMVTGTPLGLFRLKGIKEPVHLIQADFHERAEQGGGAAPS